MARGVTPRAILRIPLCGPEAYLWRTPERCRPDRLPRRGERPMKTSGIRELAVNVEKFMSTPQFRRRILPSQREDFKWRLLRADNSATVEPFSEAGAIVALTE